LLGLSAICAGLAASSVDRYADDVAAQIGPLQPVIVAARDLPRDTLITPALARAGFAERRVPLRFSPPGVLHDLREAVGYRTLTALRAGDYVGDAQLGAQRPGRPPSRRTSARLVELSVTGAGSIASALRPGGLVDVLVTTDTQSGAPRTYLALQRVELIDLRETGSTAGSADREADATATLRTTLRQAVTLTAAQNFAREVRIVPRARGDLRRLGPTSVSAASLGR